MKFTRNVKAISKLLLILLLLLATIVGAILSYLWVIGYYVSLEQVYPADITVNITDYALDHQNTSFFNVTIQNPTSYKPKETANITQIIVSTEDGVLHDKIDTNPPLPYKFQQKGEIETFKCLWNWANYTGETLKIIAFLADGSGPTFEIETSLVKLGITDLSFNSTISVTHFNVTVQNSASSVTYVNITKITVATETLSSENIEPSLPQGLDSGSSVTLKCSWNWTNYQNTSVTVAVHTSQGYMNHTTKVTPLPVTLEITKVDFNPANTTYFDITVRNNGSSPTYLNVTRITVTIEEQTVREWTVENGTKVDPHIPYTLNKNSSETFLCPWNWTEHRDKNVTITIYTLQGFTAQYSQVTPAPIILEITEIDFNPLNTASFNVTIKNSEFSIMNANITKISVTVNEMSENITDVVPSLQEGITLPPSANRTFMCSWNWTELTGKNITVVVQTQEGYSGYSHPVLLKALTITDVLFNPVDTNHFIVTVQNPTELNFDITTISAKIKDGPLLNITDVEPDLPFLLPPNTNIIFMCSCDWASHKGEEVTITIETSEGYTTSRTYGIPSA